MHLGKALPLLILVPAACWWAQRVPQTATAQSTPPGLQALRITFGERQEQTRDWSGRIELTAGRVLALQGWRFTQGDAISEPNAWTLRVKRGPYETQPHRPKPVNRQERLDTVLQAGVEITLDAPATATARIRGANVNFDIPLARLASGEVLRFHDGDVLVQRTPAPTQISAGETAQHDYPSLAIARDGTRWVVWQSYESEGDQVWARAGSAAPIRLTTDKTDVYRTAVAEDSEGRIHAVWSERSGSEWHLYERVHANGNWGARCQITNGRAPNLSHRLAARDGRLSLVWVGHKDGVSHVFASTLDGDNWTAPVQVSTAPSAWVPEAGIDSKGNTWIAWDSYRAGNYDIFLRKRDPAGNLGAEIQVTKSAVFQAHATVAVDAQDHVWVAWDESGVNWGKDWSHEDPFRGTVLYADRRPAMAIYDGAGGWQQPAHDIRHAVPARYVQFIQNPRLASDAGGRIWMTLEIRTLAGTIRDDYWAANGRWERFVTSLDASGWTPLAPLPSSSSRPEAPLQLVGTATGVEIAWTHDNRPPTGPGFYATVPNRHHVIVGALSAPPSNAVPVLTAFTESNAQAGAVHADETGDVSRVRAYRASIGGEALRILRGDFHRHTEISLDGSGDGSVEDYFRYMIDAAAMDTGILGDHNAGNDDEYSWWRTEKAVDLYHIPSRYTPLFGYERSPGYPNGHRNVVFARRGVRALPMTPAESRGTQRTGPILYPYLKKNRGIAMPHSMATSQGTDYGDNDPEVEPLVELYQAYHASYEYEGAPRAESENLRVMIHGAFKPLGFWWKALEKGLKLGVQASSDHIATHNSYTMIYAPDAARDSIVESMRRRHAYAATDNIIVDFRASDGGRTYMMGDAFASPNAPRLSVRIQGTDRLDEVVIVKDAQFVYRASPGTRDVEFTFNDTAPVAKESYYYVRVMQRDRNLAWSSPIWVSR